MESQKMRDILRKLAAVYTMPDNFKDKQVEALVSIANGMDTLCVLPTGYGKSIIYGVLPLVMDELEQDKHHTAVVVSPLKSLMFDQVAHFNARGIRSVALHSQTTQAEMKEIVEGNYSLILASPETLLKLEDELADDIYPSKICAVVIDEVHNVVDWTTFRPLYKCLDEVKSIIGGSVPWGLFTATCDKELKDVIVKSLGINNINIISTSPDRPNIYLDIEHGKGMGIEVCFKDLVEELNEKKEATPKTVIYCRSKEATGEIYCYIVSTLREAVYRLDGNLIEQFSSSYSGKDEERIVKRIVENDKNLRVIITTIALGMGMDMRGVARIYHWGVPDNVLRYWQEVGRAGRGGEQASALMFAYPLSVAHTSMDMKDIIKGMKDGKCIRRAIMSALNLGEEDFDHPKLNKCCCVCEIQIKKFP